MVDLLNLESIITTRIENKMPEKIKTKYKDLNFTTKDASYGYTHFPTVYIHLQDTYEKGHNIEGTDLNAVSTYIVAEVIDNQTQQRAKEVSDEVLKIMKGMRFSIRSMPFINNKDPFTAKKDATFRIVFRARRVIGSDDIL